MLTNYGLNKGFCEVGGEGGIRTHGGVTHARFPGVCLKPLSHLSYLKAKRGANGPVQLVPSLRHWAGGADRNRTCDLLIANETLYQLSYDPVPIAARIMRMTFRAASL